MKTLLHTTLNTSTIEYDPSVPCLIDTVREFLLSDEIRAHMNKGLELLIEKKQIHGQIGWLANTHSVSPLFEDDLKWIAEDWIPRAEQAGIGYVALVTPGDYVAEMNMEVYEDHLQVVTPGGLVTKKFKDLESAAEWLKHSMKKD